MKNSMDGVFQSILRVNRGRSLKKQTFPPPTATMKHMLVDNNDEQLVGQALAGSARAWRQLVRRHEGCIYNLGFRLTGNREDAMDLTQEVFLGVCRGLHRFRGEANFRTWMFRIAHNKAVDLNRKRKLLELTGGLDENGEFREFTRTAGATPTAGAEPGHDLAASERNRLVLGLLQRISFEQRLVVELKIYQSLTFEEIARMQEISVNTAKTRFYTALKKMRLATEKEHALLEN